MEFTVEVVPEENTIYIGQEDSSGASYIYHDIDDIGSIIKEYIQDNM